MLFAPPAQCPNYAVKHPNIMDCYLMCIPYGNYSLWPLWDAVSSIGSTVNFMVKDDAVVKKFTNLQEIANQHSWSQKNFIMLLWLKCDILKWSGKVFHHKLPLLKWSAKNWGDTATAQPAFCSVFLKTKQKSNFSACLNEVECSTKSHLLLEALPATLQSGKNNREKVLDLAYFSQVYPVLRHLYLGQIILSRTFWGQLSTYSLKFRPQNMHGSLAGLQTGVSITRRI